MYEIPADIYRWARCLPINASENKDDTQLGGAYGTLSVVRYGDVTVLVTALHVLEDLKFNFSHVGEAKQIYSPIKPGWATSNLSQYDWRKISHPLDLEGKSRFDIAYAILTDSQLKEIAERHIHTLANTTDLEFEFGAVLQGYSGKYNKTANVRRRGTAKPMSCGFTSKIEFLAPYLVPTYDDFFYFRYSEQENDVWNNEKHYKSGEKPPALSGLSGGPIFYCQNMESENAEVHPLSVVGFLLEHDKKTGIAKALSTDVLIDRIQKPHGKRNTERKNV